MVVLLAEGIHAGEQFQGGVVLPCAEVIEVQAVHQVEFLAAVLVRLVAGGRDVVVPGRAVGVVVHALEDVAARIGHNPHVALVVGEEVAVGGRAGVAEADVATVEVVFGIPKAVDLVGPDIPRGIDVCRAVGMQRVRVAVIHGGVVLHGGAVDGLQFHAVCRIDMLRHAAVVELNPHRHAAVGVVHPRHALVPVLRQRAARVVGVLAVQDRPVVEVESTGV